MKIKQHLYNGLSELYCTLYILIWVGLSIIANKWISGNPQIDFGQGILLFIVALAPYNLFEKAGENIYEYGIYRIKFYFGLSRTLWIMTIFFCFSAMTFFLVFWDVNNDFPRERIYSVVISANMLFSVTLWLLRWHFRQKPQFQELSAQLFKDQASKISDKP